MLIAKKMNERIAMIIDIAENDIKEHDKQIQKFINHLHSYLMTMSLELKAIPKKTMIKTEEDWEEIFTFNVPEWDEKKGKEELNKHIDWILKQLESDHLQMMRARSLATRSAKPLKSGFSQKNF